MYNWLAISILKQQIRIGETIIPVGFILLILFYMAIFVGLNIVYAKRYRKITAYLRKNHPELYDTVRRKPDIGIFYSTAHDSSKPLIELAKRPQMIQDGRLNKMLSDFVRFNQLMTRVSLLCIIAFVISALILAIFLSF
ncbi:hypothetical protein [Vacuolonema iberomarrocanum]|uniref:hypothetical protein n=1 Tax=Vacuolonema iberomarrocanum TaxID=3454632 RepID=UPI0019F767F2|nr:hypothetical protein [filamentous cyanobacterium LEGE 07170]